MMLLYYAVSYFFAPKPQQTTQQVVTQPDGSQQVVEHKVTAYSALWHLGLRSDLYVYVSENDRHLPHDSLVWKESGIAFGDWSDIRRAELDIPCPPSVQNNGSLYAHIFLTKAGRSPAAWKNDFVPDDTLYIRKLLTRYQLKHKEVTKKRLVGGDSSATQNSPSSAATHDHDHDHEDHDSDDDDQDRGHDGQKDAAAKSSKQRPIISYWWPNVTINIMASQDNIPLSSPPLLLKNLRLASDGIHYLPIFYVNDFWMLSEHLHPINSTVDTLHMSLVFSPIEQWRFQLYTQFDESFRIQHEVMGMEVHETENMKRMFIETNPILLAVTFIVSTLHSVFDFLAFKNDIDFWRNRNDMEGLSFRALILNIFFQAVIFLYLLDNETSWMILISTGAGLLIEVWKINKTVIIKRKNEFPFVDFIDRVKPSKLTKKTRKYDEMAFRYLSIALFPLLVGYTIYSVIYEEHKSWYSFIISTLVGFVYTFGFISMTPQLFINYKLKSVAHMPWKTFMYKALNTFIDDLFAFVIKMPWLHRLACLRDDVVFVIYLYQRRIYPEDKRRRNEFGQVGEAVTEENDDDDEDDDDEDEKSKSAQKKITATAEASKAAAHDKESKKHK
nr:hypothetical protein HK105_007466 [Polyrhizophydium stewartii]